MKKEDSECSVRRLISNGPSRFQETVLIESEYTERCNGR